MTLAVEQRLQLTAPIACLSNGFIPFSSKADRATQFKPALTHRINIFRDKNRMP